MLLNKILCKPIFGWIWPLLRTALETRQTWPEIWIWEFKDCDSNLMPLLGHTLDNSCLVVWSQSGVNCLDIPWNLSFIWFSHRPDSQQRNVGGQGSSEKRDKTRVVSFRVPHNAAVQIYDYKEKKARLVYFWYLTHVFVLRSVRCFLFLKFPVIKLISILLCPVLKVKNEHK